MQLAVEQGDLFAPLVRSARPLPRFVYFYPAQESLGLVLFLRLGLGCIQKDLISPKMPGLIFPPICQTTLLLRRPHLSAAKGHRTRGRLEGQPRRLRGAAGRGPHALLRSGLLRGAARGGRHDVPRRQLGAPGGRDPDLLWARLAGVAAGGAEGARQPALRARRDAAGGVGHVRRGRPRLCAGGGRVADTRRGQRRPRREAELAAGGGQPRAGACAELRREGAAEWQRRGEERGRCVYVYIYIYIYTHVYVYDIYIYIHIHTHIYISLSLSLFLCLSIYLSISLSIIYIYIYMYDIYIYIYI